ncbi:MAG: FeoB-associated Cys-rich membrane protein [Clostridia bacterium]|nr:FeoB-associated Cys-rich membrane protein [Clostridia bacterium]
MENVIAAIVIALILGGAIAYIVKEKKKGTKCIGCPYASDCGQRKNGGCIGKPDAEN